MSSLLSLFGNPLSPVSSGCMCIGVGPCTGAYPQRYPQRSDAPFSAPPTGNSSSVRGGAWRASIPCMQGFWWLKDYALHCYKPVYHVKTWLPFSISTLEQSSHNVVQKGDLLDGGVQHWKSIKPSDQFRLLSHTFPLIHLPASNNCQNFCGWQ